MRSTLTAIVCLGSVVAYGAPLDQEPDWSTHVDDSLSFVVNEDELPAALGTGFRLFARGLLGSGFAESNETATSQGTFTEISGFGSIELMGQYLWDGEWGFINQSPGLRGSVRMPGLGFEAGALPVENRSSLEAPTSDNQSWWQGFEQVNYISYGVRMNVGVNQIELEPNGSAAVEYKIEQYVLGPQITVGRTLTKGRWTIEANSSLLLGYAYTKFDHRVHAIESDDAFSAMGEARLATSYAFRKNWTIDLIGRAFVMTPWHQTDGVVNFNSPTLGDYHLVKSTISGANAMLGVTYLR